MKAKITKRGKKTQAKANSPAFPAEAGESDLFNSAFHYSAIGMALVSTEGKFLQANPALCEIVGYSEKALLKTDFQKITHPDDLQADLNFVREMLERKRQTYQMEKRYIHKNGSIIWISLSVSLVWSKENKPRFFISQIEDITARKKAEENLLQSHHQLEALLQERDELRKGLLTMCAWTKQIRLNDKWISVEKFLHETFGITTSHGISDEALDSMNKDIEEMKKEKTR